jgi:hypothetical protein
MKINSKIYKGIEYIQITELPSNQRERLLQTLNRDLFIKIMIDGKIISQCLQYKDYAVWFKNVYQPWKTSLPEEITKEEKVMKEKSPVEADLVYDH